MKKTIRLIGFLSAILIGPQPMRADDGSRFCTTADLDPHKDLQKDESLERYLACGQYSAIIQHYAAENLTTGPSARYYRGAAYYGLYSRSRASSLKCNFARLARKDFAAVTALLKSTGVASHQEFDRIYSAARALEDLKSLTGCPDNGLSEDEIKLLARNLIETRLKSIFVGGPAKDALGEQLVTMKAQIQEIMSSFLSRSAQVETQLQLRSTALDASQFQLTQIVLALRGIGKVDVRKNPAGDITDIAFTLDPNMGYNSAKSKSENWKAQVDGHQRELVSALNGISVERYEDARHTQVLKALYVIQETSTSVNLHGSISDLPSLSFLADELKKPAGGAVITTAIASIEKGLRDSNGGMIDCNFSSVKPWFCDGAQRAFFNRIPDMN